MLDYISIFKEFYKREIKYIVVGGLAVNFHGIPRATYDIDLLLKMADDNLKRFLELMKQWRFRPKIPVDIMDFAKKEKREDWMKNKYMKAFNLLNSKAVVKEIDVVIKSIVNYELADATAVYIELQDVKIPVIGIRELIKMKKSAGREQDKADIRYLKRKIEDEE